MTFYMGLAIAERFGNERVISIGYLTRIILTSMSSLEADLKAEVKPHTSAACKITGDRQPGGDFQ